MSLDSGFTTNSVTLEIYLPASPTLYILTEGRIAREEGKEQERRNRVEKERGESRREGGDSGREKEDSAGQTIRVCILKSLYSSVASSVIPSSLCICAC